jgi:hypothetical protein
MLVKVKHQAYWVIIAHTIFVMIEGVSCNTTFILYVARCEYTASDSIKPGYSSPSYTCNFGIDERT